MNLTITSGIERLSLHDSRFMELNRRGEEMDLNFDWAKLSDFKEQDIHDFIVLGKTRIYFTGVKSEDFKLLENESTYLTVLFPPDFLERVYVVSFNEIDDFNKIAKISGLIANNSKYDFFEWEFEFSTCSVTWNSHKTKIEWLNGELPVD